MPQFPVFKEVFQPQGQATEGRTPLKFLTFHMPLIVVGGHRSLLTNNLCLCHRLFSFSQPQGQAQEAALL
jgi:hypothetical protein